MRSFLLNTLLFVLAIFLSTASLGCAGGGADDMGFGDGGGSPDTGSGLPDGDHGPDGSHHTEGGHGHTDTGGPTDAPSDTGPAGEGGEGGTAKFTIGGMVTGLTGTGLVLQDNASDNLSVTTNGPFTFAVPVASGGTYSVATLLEPVSPGQTCTVSGGMGTVAKADVTSVVVNCTADTYTIGGMISGLAGTVVLQDNGGDNLTVTANGSFAFATPIVMGGMYAVTVLTQPPVPSQTCTLTGDTGTVASSNITSVLITCTTNTFTIGGTVSMLAGTGLVLRDNGGDDLPITTNGSFAFVTPVASGSSYTVTVYTNPSVPTQVCNVTGGLGTVTNADVITVAVSCTTQSYTIGGMVTGLASGDSVVLQDNGADNLTVTTNGSFTFPTTVLSGGTYSATVLTQPGSPVQNCVITSGSGPVVSSDVTSIVVTCVSECGRFTTGYSGAWSTVAANPLPPGMGMSGYLPGGGSATTYLLHASALDQYSTSTNAYTPLAASPIAFSDLSSAAWLGNALWAMTGGDVLRYDIPTNMWTIPASALTMAASTQTTNDDAGNLWGYSSASALLEYDTAAATSSSHTLTTALGVEGRIVFDGCSGLLYLTSYNVLPFYSYDPASGVQKTLTGLPGSNHFQDGFCGDRSGHIFAVTNTATVYQYTIATSSWAAMPAGGPTGSGFSACGVGADGYLYATDPFTSSTMYRIQLK